MKKAVKDVLIIVLAFAAIFAAWYVFFLSQPGIQVSCSEKSILGFKRVPPPLAAVVQPITCIVELTAIANGSILCNGSFSVLDIDKGVFPCKELDSHLNETIKIEANFSDANNQILGSDKKDLIYAGLK